MMEWTDDMRVRIDPDRTIDELVDRILDAPARGTTHAQLLDALSTEFALSYPDARPAIDRALGGVARAATQGSSNEPSATRDPIAHRAYCRSRGVHPGPRAPRETPAWAEMLRLLEASAVDQALQHAAVELDRAASGAERDAAGAWRDATEAAARGTRTMGSVDAALLLAELAERTLHLGVSDARKRNVLLQLGTALAGARGAIADRLGERRYSDNGSDEWIDAIRVVRSARGLARGFERLGDLESAASAVEVAGRVTTRALGHCYERVGPIMVDCARIALRLGEAQRAIHMCDAVVSDFTRLLEELEVSGESLLEEDVVAVNALADAMALRKAAGAPADDALGDRVRAILARVPEMAATSS